MQTRLSLPRTCAACGAPFHLATGHVLSWNAVLCGGCAKDFWKWRKGREGAMQARRKDPLTGKKQEQSFAEAAAESIIGDDGGATSGR